MPRMLFFFQAEDGIRDLTVTGVQTCALPICVREPGIARFDVLQQHDDPARFVLVEVYRSESAPAPHKETAHYAKWREVGRAAWRGRGEISGGAGSFKKKKKIRRRYADVEVRE